MTPPPVSLTTPGARLVFRAAPVPPPATSPGGPAPPPEITGPGKRPPPGVRLVAAPGHRFFEGVAYPFTAEPRRPGGPPVRLRCEDPEAVKVAPGRGPGQHGVIHFVARVGLARFTLEVGGRPEAELTLEIFPTRLRYREDYRRMLAEIQEFFAALALEFLRRSYQLGATRRAPGASDLEWLTLLRHVGERLEDALRFIAERPRLGLVRVPRMVRQDRVRRVDSALRRDLRRRAGAGPLRDLPGGLRAREVLRTRRAEVTLDTPEHRWLRAQLDEVGRRVRELRARVGREGVFPDPAEADAALGVLAARVRRGRRLAPLAAATRPPPPGFTSLQLLHAPGYREAYRALVMLQLGLHIHDGPLELPLKRIDTLYGYWVYVTALKLVSRIQGAPVPAADFFAVRPQGLQVQVRPGAEHAARFAGPGKATTRVVYRPALGGPPWMPSRPPELLVAVQPPGSPATNLLLDARYDVRFDPATRAGLGAPGPPKPRLADLHRWRDGALDHGPGEPARAVVAAAVAYPYRPDDAAAFRRTKLWRGVEIMGVGGIPALPGETRWLADWLRPYLTAPATGRDPEAFPHRLQAAIATAAGERAIRVWVPPAELARGATDRLRMPPGFAAGLPPGVDAVLLLSPGDAHRLAPVEGLRLPAGGGVEVVLGAARPLRLAAATRAALREAAEPAGTVTDREALRRAEVAAEPGGAGSGNAGVGGTGPGRAGTVRTGPGRAGTGGAGTGDAGPTRAGAGPAGTAAPR